jgi:hypothetical protein
MDFDWGGPLHFPQTERIALQPPQKIAIRRPPFCFGLSNHPFSFLRLNLDELFETVRPRFGHRLAHFLEGEGRFLQD